jgi:hypothetical protein
VHVFYVDIVFLVFFYSHFVKKADTLSGVGRDRRCGRRCTQCALLSIQRWCRVFSMQVFRQRQPRLSGVPCSTIKRLNDRVFA